MTTLRDALSLIMQKAVLMPAETIDFTQSLDRVLAQDVYSDINMPPFDKSAMDGFAIRIEDAGEELEIIETIPAGSTPGKTIGPNQCARIMTGAPLPNGANWVVMHEDTETRENRIKILKKPGKSNICLMGEDIRKGDKVLEKGINIKPQHLAMIATVGHTKVSVYSKPLVNVIVTGDELVEPHLNPGASKIRNSNAYQLTGQIAETGCSAKYRGIVKDKEDILTGEIESAFSTADILIVTGGASKGDFDFVPPILTKLGFEISFSEVAIQPGKPVSFASKNQKICFGLSGNPVSSFFQYELIVKPFLHKIVGVTEPDKVFRIPVSKDIRRKKTTREYFFPVSISEKSEAVPLEFHGSAHIGALMEADGIASVEIGIAEIKKGEYINVRQI